MKYICKIDCHTSLRYILKDGSGAEIIPFSIFSGQIVDVLSLKFGQVIISFSHSEPQEERELSLSMREFNFCFEELSPKPEMQDKLQEFCWLYEIGAEEARNG